jgi:hypothetical protein
MTFSEFWSAYPRRVARLAAEKAWKRLSAEQQKDAIEGLSRYKQWLALCGVEHAYILHASTYLNQQRWTDEYEMPEEKTQGQWWKSEASTLEMAKRVGVQPRSAEDWESLRARIRASLVRVA